MSQTKKETSKTKEGTPETKEGTPETKGGASDEYLLLDAAANGEKKTVQKLLLDSNINVNFQDDHNNTALALAATEGHLKIVKALLADERIDVNKIGNLDESTALILAAREGRLNIVKALLADERVDVNSKESLGSSALYYAVIDQETEMVKALLDAGAETNDTKLNERLDNLIKENPNNKRFENIKILLSKKGGFTKRRNSRKHRRTKRKLAK
jgi:ankyrin repeat protein